MRRNKRKGFCLVSGLAAGVMAAPVLAQDEVHIKAYNSRTGGSEFQSWVLDSAEAASIALPSAALRVNITTDTVNDTIGALTFTGGPSADYVHIIVGSETTFNGSEPGREGDDLQGLDASALFDGRLYGGINGDLTGDILMERIARFDLGGAISAAIDANRQNAVTEYRIHADSLNADGSITCSVDNVHEIIITNSILGDIFVEGNLGTLKGSGFYGQDGAAGIRLDVNGALGELNVDAHFADNLTIEIDGTVNRFRSARDDNPLPFKASCAVGGFTADWPIALQRGWGHTGDFSGSFKVRGNLT